MNRLVCLVWFRPQSADHFFLWLVNWVGRNHCFHLTFQKTDWKLNIGSLWSMRFPTKYSSQKDWRIQHVKKAWDLKTSCQNWHPILLKCMEHLNSRSWNFAKQKNTPNSHNGITRVITYVSLSLFPHLFAGKCSVFTMAPFHAKLPCVFWYVSTSGLHSGEVKKDVTEKFGTRLREFFVELKDWNSSRVCPNKNTKKLHVWSGTLSLYRWYRGMLVSKYMGIT